MKRSRLIPISVDNCAINERTGDGDLVGRCWFRLALLNGRYSCERHGDVTDVRAAYIETGRLTPERQIPKPG